MYIYKKFQNCPSPYISIHFFYSTSKIYQSPTPTEPLFFLRFLTSPPPIHHHYLSHLHASFSSSSSFPLLTLVPLLPPLLHYQIKRWDCNYFWNELQREGCNVNGFWVLMVLLIMMLVVLFQWASEKNRRKKEAGRRLSNMAS